MESVSLWIALTPEQFSTLNSGKEIEPDPYSQRFGLRTSPGEAIDRAQYFMDWTPEGMKGEHHQKEFTVCQVEISALGYMQKMEAGTLAKTKPGEYRWYGTMKHEERDDQGRVLYRFSDTAAQVLWRQKSLTPDPDSREDLMVDEPSFWIHLDWCGSEKVWSCMPANRGDGLIVGILSRWHFNLWQSTPRLYWLDIMFICGHGSSK